MKIAISQISPKLSRNNFSLHKMEISKAIPNADIIVFPELSLNGYMLMDSVYEDAFFLEELSVFEDLSRDIDIIIGAATKEAHKIFNSALYFSQGKLLSIHHKNILPNYGMFQEARFFFRGESVNSFETQFGRAIMIVCEDLWSSGIIDYIATQKPALVYVIANSPAREFNNNELGIEKKWDKILSTAAILSGSHVVFANRVGFEDGLGFWGGSKIINPAGAVISQALLFDREQLFGTISHGISSVKKYLLRTN
jgi:predicted amidohydrolase